MLYVAVCCVFVVCCCSLLRLFFGCCALLAVDCWLWLFDVCGSQFVAVRCCLLFAAWWRSLSLLAVVVCSVLLLRLVAVV